MKVIRCILIALATVLIGTTLLGRAEAQVVADDACPYYAVDAAAFVTCDGDHAARADGSEVEAEDVALVGGGDDIDATTQERLLLPLL